MSERRRRARPPPPPPPPPMMSAAGRRRRRQAEATMMAAAQARARARARGARARARARERAMCGARDERRAARRPRPRRAGRPPILVLRSRWRPPRRCFVGQHEQLGDRRSAAPARLPPSHPRSQSGCREKRGGLPGARSRGPRAAGRRNRFPIVSWGGGVGVSRVFSGNEPGVLPDLVQLRAQIIEGERLEQAVEGAPAPRLRGDFVLGVGSEDDDRRRVGPRRQR